VVKPLVKQSKFVTPLWSEHSLLLSLLTPAYPRVQEAMEISLEDADKDKTPRLIVILEKLRPGGLSSKIYEKWQWQKRCFVIYTDKMCYFESGEKFLSGDAAKATVPLEHMWALFVEKSGKDSRPEMTLRIPWRDYRLRVASPDDPQEVRASPCTPFHGFPHHTGWVVLSAGG